MHFKTFPAPLRVNVINVWSLWERILKKVRGETSKFRAFISFYHTFFLFVLHNKIYMIRIKKQNVLL